MNKRTMTTMEVSKLPLANVVSLLDFFQTKDYRAFVESSGGGVFLNVLERLPKPEWLN